HRSVVFVEDHDRSRTNIRSTRQGPIRTRARLHLEVRSPGRGDVRGTGEGWSRLRNVRDQQRSRKDDASSRNPHSDSSSYWLFESPPAAFPSGSVLKASPVR